MIEEHDSKAGVWSKKSQKAQVTVSPCVVFHRIVVFYLGISFFYINWSSVYPFRYKVLDFGVFFFVLLQCSIASLSRLL